MGQEGEVCELLWGRSSPLIDASRVNWNGQWEQASSKTVQFCICGSVEHGKVEVCVVRACGKWWNGREVRCVAVVCPAVLYAVCVESGGGH